MTGFVCNTAHVTNGGSSEIMSTAKLELPYPFSSQAKSRDETSRRGSNMTIYDNANYKQGSL